MNDLEIKKKWVEQEIAILKMLETIAELESRIDTLSNGKSNKRRKSKRKVEK